MANGRQTGVYGAFVVCTVPLDVPPCFLWLMTPPLPRHHAIRQRPHAMLRNAWDHGRRYTDP
jgi:hypothetical protein